MIRSIVSVPYAYEGLFNLPQPSTHLFKRPIVQRYTVVLLLRTPNWIIYNSNITFIWSNDIVAVLTAAHRITFLC